jgi:hypothetical protein
MTNIFGGPVLFLLAPEHDQLQDFPVMKNKLHAHQQRDATHCTAQSNAANNAIRHVYFCPLLKNNICRQISQEMCRKNPMNRRQLTHPTLSMLLPFSGKHPPTENKTQLTMPRPIPFHPIHLSPKVPSKQTASHSLPPPPMSYVSFSFITTAI